MDFARVLSAYRSLDPEGWVRAYQLLPTWAGMLCIGAGATLLLFGGGRAFRLVAAPMGALAGFLWAPAVTSHLGLGGLETQVGSVAAALLFALGLAFPPGLLFFAFGLPVGIASGELAGGGDWLLGFVPAFLLAGTLAAVFSRYLAALASALLGAWLGVMGALAALHQLGTFTVQAAARPALVLGTALLLAATGAVFQLVIRPSPEERERRRSEAALARTRRAERKRLEERWSRYSREE